MNDNRAQNDTEAVSNHCKGNECRDIPRYRAECLR